MQGLNGHGNSARPLTPAECAELFAPLKAHARLALAVSGGGDSLALLHLVADWAANSDSPPALHVLTVDHGLHPASADVAEEVCRQAAQRDLPCAILRWTGEKPGTGIEAAARHARYALLAGWCRRHDAALVTAHTLQDQAETLLMRLARGAGVDGLAAMAPAGMVPGAWPPVPLLRPLLNVSRSRLRATLATRGIAWHDDPANTDERFERVRLRRLLALLSEHGIAPEAIATSARRLQRARRALQRLTGDFLQRHVRLHDPGWAEVELAALSALPEELQLRVLAWLLGHLGGQGHPLRDMAGLERLLNWLHTGQGRARTLGGACISRRRNALLVCREPGRPGPPLPLAPNQPRGIWDRRFDIAIDGLSTPVSVLMLHQAPQQTSSLPHRPAHVPATAWRAQPAIVHRKHLVALPAIGWQAPDAPFTRASATFLPLR